MNNIFEFFTSKGIIKQIESDDDYMSKGDSLK